MGFALQVSDRSDTCSAAHCLLGADGFEEASGGLVAVLIVLLQPQAACIMWSWSCVALLITDQRFTTGPYIKVREVLRSAEPSNATPDTLQFCSRAQSIFFVRMTSDVEPRCECFT